MLLPILLLDASPKHLGQVNMPFSLRYKSKIYYMSNAEWVQGLVNQVELVVRQLSTSVCRRRWDFLDDTFAISHIKIEEILDWITLAGY